MSHDAAPPKPGEVHPALSGRKAMAFVLVLIAAAAAVAILGIVPRVRARTTLQQQTDQLAIPDVLVRRPPPARSRKRSSCPRTCRPSPTRPSTLAPAAT